MFERKVPMEEFIVLFNTVKQLTNTVEKMLQKIEDQDALINALRYKANRQRELNNSSMALTQDDGTSLADAMLIATAISSSYSDTSSSSSTSYDYSSCDSSSSSGE